MEFELSLIEFAKLMMFRDHDLNEIGIEVFS